MYASAGVCVCASGGPSAMGVGLERGLLTTLAGTCTVAGARKTRFIAIDSEARGIVSFANTRTEYWKRNAPPKLSEFALFSFHVGMT